MQKVKYFIIYILTIISVWGCGQNNYQKMAEYSGYAQGATFHITCDESGAKLDKEIEDLVKTLDHSISGWDSLSLVSQFNRSPNGIWVDKYFVDVLSISKRIHSETEGAFNPAIFPIRRAATIKASANDSIKKIPVDSLLKFCRLEDIQLGTKEDSGNGNLRFVQKRYAQSGLDFQGIGQGYTVDVICTFLDSKGVKNYKVEVGKQFRVKGFDQQNQPWRMSLDKPTLAGEIRVIQSIIPINDKAVSISGDYREYHNKNGLEYNNYISPFTGQLTENPLLNAYVFAKTAAEADAYATAFMVMGAGKTTQFISRRKDIQAYLISSGFNGDFQTWMSPALERLIEESK